MQMRPRAVRRAFPANGSPLSVRITCGGPCSLTSRSKSIQGIDVFGVWVRFGDQDLTRGMVGDGQTRGTELFATIENFIAGLSDIQKERHSAVMRIAIQ